MSLSKINKKITIEYLQQLENLYFERKSGNVDLKTIANEVMALANAKGGIVAFGIADNENIDGVKIKIDLSSPFFTWSTKGKKFEGLARKW